jgi:hypothetical protein
LSRRKVISPALVEWTWLALRQAAARHGKTWRSALSDARYKLIEAALRQASPHEVAHAVDGFIAKSSDWTPEIRANCFNPEYILRPTKLDQHVEEANVRATVAERMETRQSLTTAVLAAAVAEVSVEQNIAEASELRALGFFGEVGDRA